MTGEITAIGDIASGALLGRAMEPHAGEGGGHGHGGMCLNCGTALIGAHCHHCGQSGHVHRSLAGMGHELLHGVFHFEGKLWSTLPMLAWRPGQLTRRYIDGERARFVSPIAIFLFSIFALFAVFSWMGVTPSANTVVRTPQQLSELRQNWEKRRDQLIVERDALPRGSEKHDALTDDIGELNDQIGNLKIGENAGGPLARDKHFSTGWHTLDHGLEKWATNPNLMFYKLQSSSYKYSWLLIILSVPFLWLMFVWRRQYRLYDHAVFVTYSIAFMSLLFIGLSLLDVAGISVGWLTLAALVIVPIHMFRQLKDTYALSNLRAVLRTVALLFASLIVLVLFLLLILLIGVMG